MRPESEEFLRGSSLLKFLPQEHYDKLRALFKEQRFDFGDVIIKEGDEADALYILTLGRARILGKSDHTGQEFTMNVLRPGDEFGEAGFFSGGKPHGVGQGEHGCGSASPEPRRLRDDHAGKPGDQKLP
jgi:CRP-like cAMP-binding protein